MEPCSEAQDQLAAALVKFAGRAKQPKHNSTGQVGTREYPYADLTSVLDSNRELLAECKLALTQQLWLDDSGELLIATELIHESGQFKRALFPIGNHGTSQEIGSRITYGRRYSASAILGLASEHDDDGAEGSKQPMPQRTKQKRPEAKAEPKTVEEAMTPQTMPRMEALDTVVQKLNEHAADLIGEWNMSGDPTMTKMFVRAIADEMHKGAKTLTMDDAREIFREAKGRITVTVAERRAAEEGI